MNYYDKENRIIECLQNTSLRNIRFVNFSAGLFRFCLSLYAPFMYRYWTDNSGKNNTPPDFYSDEYKYMLEVMRFDDYEPGSNNPNAIESKRIKAINDERRKNGLNLFDNEHLVLYLNPDISMSSLNNFDIYYANFCRVTNNHNSKCDAYRSAHPGYKLGFLLFDESPAYGETKDKYIGTPYAGDLVGPLRYVYTPYVRKFFDQLMLLNVNYVIWVTPFKQLPTFDSRGIINAYAIDIDKAKKKQVKSINYDENKILCLEANERDE